MIINGDLTYLVPFDESHLNNPDYFKWLTDIEVVKYIGRDEYLKPIRFEVVREYVEGLWKSDYCSFFAVCQSEEKKFIGTIKVNYVDVFGLMTRTADIGIMIGDRDYWGRGLATDAIFAICKYAFSVLGARKLTAGGVSANIGVIKAFMKVGFVKEGCLRKKLMISGNYFDHVLLGCFENELVLGI